MSVRLKMETDTMSGSWKAVDTDVCRRSFSKVLVLSLQPPAIELAELSPQPRWQQRQGHASPLPPPSGSSESLSLPRGVRHQPGHPIESLPHDPASPQKPGFLFWR